MILAAGLGQRMRPLTDHLPKPLLPVAGKPLLQYHLEALARAGVEEVVINLAYLGDQIRAFVGDGSPFGLRVSFSEEHEPLETGGGVLKALHLLGADPFLLVNGDVWTDWRPEFWRDLALAPGQLGHLLLVPNPDFHPRGDFSLGEGGYLHSEGQGLRYTFAGISMLDPQLIAAYPARREKFPLVEALRAGMGEGLITGEVYSGRWSDVGTPERLTELEQTLARSPY